MNQASTKDIPTQSYAIFKTGGKQYQAKVNETIAIEKLNADVGTSIVFDEVLLRKIVTPEGEVAIQIGQPYLTTPITARIVKHLRGPKVIAFKFKRRKKYKRKQGHRQPVTVVRIEAI